MSRDARQWSFSDRQQVRFVPRRRGLEVETAEVGAGRSLEQSLEREEVGGGYVSLVDPAVQEPDPGVVERLRHEHPVAQRGSRMPLRAKYCDSSSETTFVAP